MSKVEKVEFKMTSNLLKLIELYPSNEVFCLACGIKKSELSMVLNGRRELSKKLIVAIQTYTKWPLDELFRLEIGIKP